MPHVAKSRVLHFALVSLGLTLGGLGSAKAVTLGQVLERVEGAPNRAEVCQEAALENLRPGQLRSDECRSVVSSLYLDQLRKRELLQSIEMEIEVQRIIQGLLQKQLEGGAGSASELLLAEIELKRWQLEETELRAGIDLCALFFQTFLSVDAATFVRPRISEEAWPESKSAALAALSTNTKLAQNDLSIMRWRLQSAWIDYEAAKRDLVLLRPMTAFAKDLTGASRQSFEVGQLSLTDMQSYQRDEVSLRNKLVDAGYAMLSIQIRVLDILRLPTAIE